MKTMIMIQMTKSVAAAGALLLLASCDVKDPIYNTSHPGHAMVTLTTDWSAIGQGLPMPASYSVEALRTGSDKPAYSADLTGVTNKLDHLFEPGDYRFYVYNTPECVTVKGTVASVVSEEVTPQAADEGPADMPRRFVYAFPDWFYTCALDATLAADTEHTLTAPMQQQVRQLTILLEPKGDSADRIEEIAGVLTGVAGTFDMRSGTHGAPSCVPIRFEKVTSGPDAGKWAATVRLLGVAGSGQTIAGMIYYAGGEPDSTPFNNDLSTKLATFNADKRTPLTLGGTVKTPDQAGLSATIDDWQVVEGGPIVAQ